VSEYLYFNKLNPPPGRKMPRFEIMNRATDAVLGEIRWYGAWRKYCFYPGAEVLFDEKCLREIADFCEARTRGHRENPRPSAATSRGSA
jgi:hypothetical protein